MKAVQAEIQASGLRADGRVVSEMVKAALARLERFSAATTALRSSSD